MKVLTIDFQRPDAGQRLVRSLHETGFAILRNHSISRVLMDDIYREWQAFFDSESKSQYAHDPNSAAEIQDGYYSVAVSEKAVGATHRDNKEFYHVVPGGKLPRTLAPKIYAYREQAMRLGSKLLHWIHRHTPKEVTDRFSAPISESLSDSATLLRVLHYPKMPEQVESQVLRAAAHEDINFLTILPVANEPGLQVRGKDNNWIDLGGYAGELIINIGDMLQESSEGYFPSTTHRVVNPTGERCNVSRISVPLFLTPHLDFVLSDRYTAGSYLTERLQQISG